MGDRLKFTFGHVIAFVSLMFIGYVTFMGAVYFSYADFEWALVAVSIEVVGLYALMMLLQKMKTVQHDFKKNIWIERFIVLLMVVCCCYAFTHYMRFWNVFENRDEVSKRFATATAAADDIFVGYNNYCNERINSHKCVLREYYHLNGNQLLYQVNDSLLVVKLQSDVYRNFEVKAREWIMSTSNGVSVWNVFMMSNEKIMKAVVDDWYNDLVSMSKGRVSTENSVMHFDKNRYYINRTHDKITSLESLFSTDGYTSWSLIGIPFFLLLFLPYIIQDRYYRSTYILLCFHSAVDSSGRRHIYWGRDKSWVQRHVNDIIIEDYNGRSEKIVEKLDSDALDYKANDIVTHMKRDKFKRPNSIVKEMDNIGDISADSIIANARKREYGKTDKTTKSNNSRIVRPKFDYDNDEDIKSIVTHL